MTDFARLSESEQGMWLNWLIAQEQLRRAAISGESILTPQLFWQNKSHEIDFVVSHTTFVEVKRGACNPLGFLGSSSNFLEKS